jgi:hypothetical protein
MALWYLWRISSFSRGKTYIFGEEVLSLNIEHSVQKYSIDDLVKTTFTD